MKKEILPLLAIILLVSQSCGNDARQQNNIENVDHIHTDVDTIHSSQNSIDWHGKYEGKIACADCPGIQTTVILNIDETFQYEAEYLDKAVTIYSSGKIMWHDNGAIVHLHSDSVDLKYKVGEHILYQLDSNGKEIEGAQAQHYQLVKTE